LCVCVLQGEVLGKSKLQINIHGGSILIEEEISDRTQYIYICYSPIVNL